MEPQLLAPQPELHLPFSRHRRLKVAPAQDRLVEDIGLDQEPRLAGAEVLVVVQLADPGGNLADLPAAEAGGEEVPAVVLLEAPELGVGLEGLFEIEEVVGPAGVRGEGLGLGELAVGRVD